MHLLVTWLFAEVNSVAFCYRSDKGVPLQFRLLFLISSQTTLNDRWAIWLLLHRIDLEAVDHLWNEWQKGEGELNIQLSSGSCQTVNAVRRMASSVDFQRRQMSPLSILCRVHRLISTVISLGTRTHARTHRNKPRQRRPIMESCQ